MYINKNIKILVNGVELQTTSVEMEMGVEGAYPEMSIRGYLRELRVGESEEMDKYCETSCETSAARLYREGTKGEDYKVLRKAGLVREDGTLTSNGAELLVELLFDKHKDELVTVAKELNAAEKK